MTQRFLDLGQHCIPDAARGSRSHPPPPPGASSPVLPDGGGGFRHASCEATMETAEPLCRAEFSTRWKELATMVTPIEREALLELLHRDHYSVDELARLLGVDPHLIQQTPTGRSRPNRDHRVLDISARLFVIDPPSRDTGPPRPGAASGMPRPRRARRPALPVISPRRLPQEKNGASSGIAGSGLLASTQAASCYGSEVGDTQRWCHRERDPPPVKPSPPRPSRHRHHLPSESTVRRPTRGASARRFTRVSVCGAADRMRTALISGGGSATRGCFRHRHFERMTFGRGTRAGVVEVPPQ